MMAVDEHLLNFLELSSEKWRPFGTGKPNLRSLQHLNHAEVFCGFRPFCPGTIYQGANKFLRILTALQSRSNYAKHVLPNAFGSSESLNLATWLAFCHAAVGRIPVRNNTAINLQAATTAILTIASDGTATNELSIEAGSNLKLSSPAFALTLTYSGTGSTGNIAGTAEVTSPATGTVINTFGFTGGTTPVTTVTATGVLSAGQRTGTGAAVITGTAATLIINGTYNQKFQVVAGTIPTATWNTGSKVNITGYTATVTAGPSGFNQTFYDVEWNCPSQTTNINCACSNPNINGTFTIMSTGAGANFLSMTATTAYTKTCANFAQTGGILDLATGSSDANTIAIPGTFNQSGGTFKSSGTNNWCHCQFQCIAGI